MRCKYCKGMLSHYITDIKGQRLFKCNNHLTAFGANDRVPHLILCGQVYDEKGKIADGHYAYRTGGNISTLLVLNGQVN